MYVFVSRYLFHTRSIQVFFFLRAENKEFFSENGLRFRSFVFLNLSSENSFTLWMVFESVIRSPHSLAKNV